MKFADRLEGDKGTSLLPRVPVLEKEICLFSWFPMGKSYNCVKALMSKTFGTRKKAPSGPCFECGLYGHVVRDCLRNRGSPGKSVPGGESKRSSSNRNWRPGWRSNNKRA